MSGHCSRMLEVLGTKCPCLRSAGGFVIVMCIFAAFHQMVVSGLVPSILSSLETRYGFNSVQSGLILSIYDFVKLFFVIPVSYVGGKGHIPRNMAVCCLILSFGMFLFVSPELFGSRYIPAGGVQGGGLCTATATACEPSTPSGFYYLFLIGQGFMALGGSAPYCIGPAYIISNSQPKRALAYMGAFYASSALGPAIGFLGGGAMLKAWVDPSGLPAGYENLSPSDVLWVGNWWMGTLIAGVAVLLLIPFFLVMPRRMPSAPPTEELEENVTYGAKDGFAMVKKIATTPAWWLITASVTSEAFAVSGYTGFGPKYMQNQFGLQASTASILAGGGVVPAAVIGMFFGGWWDGRRHTKLSQTAMFNVKCAVASTILVVITCFLGCDNGPIQGVDLATSHTNLVQGCNSPVCSCSETYTPICGADQITYFNPCYAGCTNYNSITGDYSNCSCVFSNQSSVTANLMAATATSGACSINCDAMIGLFMLFFFLFLLFTFMNHTPSTAIMMRVVPESHKSMSLGMNDFIYKLLGTIPGPLVFGDVFDNNCVLNAASCGGESGNCIVYNNLKVRLILFLVIGAVFKGISTIFNTMTYRNLKSHEATAITTDKLDPGEEPQPDSDARIARADSIKDTRLSLGLVSEALGEVARDTEVRRSSVSATPSSGDVGLTEEAAPKRDSSST